MINAVRRMNIPEKMLKTLESFYRNPRFRIKDRDGSQTGANKEQELVKDAHYPHTSS